jgi:hypothetical protein
MAKKAAPAKTTAPVKPGGVKSNGSKPNGAKSSSAEKSPKPAAKPPKAPADGALTSELIGETAGLVWQALSESGDQSVANLKKSVDRSTDAIVAALGWLAREDKLSFESSGKEAKVSLK